MKKIALYSLRYLNTLFTGDSAKLPRNINFPITDNCNSKCVMCDVWKENSKDDISVEQIDKIFKNKLFKKVEHIGLSGGEPTLRKDLTKIVESLLENLSSLKTISITSHGYHTDIWANILPDLKSICKKYKVELKLNFSVDGDVDIHNSNRGIKDAFKKVTDTIEISKSNGIQPQIQHTVTPVNFNSLNSSLSVITELSSDFVMRRSVEVARLENKSTIEKLGSYERLNSVFSDFILNSTLLNLTKNPARRLFYKDLAKRLAYKTERKAPCYYQSEGLVVTAKGDLYHCSISYETIGNALTEDAYTLYFSEKSQIIREKLINNVCKTCLHDQNGAWSPIDLFSEIFTRKFQKEVDLVRKLWKLLKLSSKLVVTEPFQKKKINLEKSYSEAIIIGAYGGEHVGDSAILGGVIERIFKKYNTTKFTILSFRPDRTKIWLDGLLFNQNFEFIIIDKEDYKSLTIKSDVPSIVVYAGGPIMQLYEDLFLNNIIVNYFKSKNKPFVIEGCGYGPFSSKLGDYLGTKLLEKAEQVVMRQPLNKPYISYDQKHDPAFDYLENYSKSPLISTIKNSLEYKKRVIVNLRPLWYKYAEGIDLEGIEDKICQIFSELIIRNQDKLFIFVPFNFDHLGFSDITPALKIKRMVNSYKNFQIIEKELTFKEIIPVLNHSDYSVCMRFHACIFTSSLGIPTMGIDYLKGGKGKVNGLHKQGKIQQITSIESITIEELDSFINS